MEKSIIKIEQNEQGNLSLNIENADAGFVAASSALLLNTFANQNPNMPRRVAKLVVLECADKFPKPDEEAAIIQRTSQNGNNY